MLPQTTMELEKDVLLHLLRLIDPEEAKVVVLNLLRIVERQPMNHGPINQLHVEVASVIEAYTLLGHTPPPSGCGVTMHPHLPSSSLQLRSRLTRDDRLSTRVLHQAHERLSTAPTGLAVAPPTTKTTVLSLQPMSVLLLRHWVVLDGYVASGGHGMLEKNVIDDHDSASGSDRTHRQRAIQVEPQRQPNHACPWSIVCALRRQHPPELTAHSTPSRGHILQIVAEVSKPQPHRRSTGEAATYLERHRGRRYDDGLARHSRNDGERGCVQGEQLRVGERHHDRLFTARRSTAYECTCAAGADDGECRCARVHDQTHV